MSNVTQLNAHRRQSDAEKVLEVLLGMAKRNELHGVILTCTHAEGMGVYAMGEFDTDPELAITATQEQMRVIMKNIDYTAHSEAS